MAQVTGGFVATFRFVRCALALVGLVVPLGATVAAPSNFVLEGGSIAKLDTGHAEGTVVLVLKLSGDAAVTNAALELSDRSADDSPTVTVTFRAEEPNVGTASRTWFVAATVAGLPINSTVQRYLTASYGGYHQTLPYTVTNKPSTTFSWTVAPPQPTRRWNAIDPLRFTVNIQSIPATQVRLQPSSFSDAQALGGLERTFRLCRGNTSAGDGACDGNPLSLAANQVHELMIQPIGTQGVAPGEYKGSFTLLAMEKPDGENFAVTLHVSNTTMQLIGAGLILVGLLLAWFVNVYLAGRYERNLALRPAALLSERATELQSEVTQISRKTGVTFDNTARELKKVFGDLSSKSLDAQGFLGDGLAFFKRSAGSQRKTYEQLLTETETRIALLSLLIGGGYRRATLAWDTNLGQREIVKRALRDMDALLQIELTRDELATKLTARLASMYAELQGVQQDDTIASTPAQVGYSIERIAFEMAAINFGGWVVFALLSFGLGCYLLILTDPDFGQLKDLFLCLIWGFGLPAAGEKLADLGSPQIGRVFGVSLTRST